MSTLPSTCRHSAHRLLGVLCATGAAALAQPAAVDPRAVQVETGLLPAVLTPRTVPMRLADRMQQLQVPGLSIAVVDHGRLAWAQAWGVARSGQPMTPETLLQAASISKPVSAVAALLLVQQGRLQLDADINTRLRTWQVPPGAQTAAAPVTLRRLLSHSAGFSVAGFDGYSVGAPVPTLLQVLDGLPPANSAPVRVDLPPGSQWRYAGGGYAVLQQVLQDTTGQLFAPWMQQAVLAPAGMAHSFFAPDGPLAPAQLAAAAAGHHNGQAIAGAYRIHPELAAAGLWTTATDLAQFSLALPQLLAAETLREALTPQADQSGLGLVLDPATGRFGHDGSNAGFEARWLADTQGGGRAVVLMANSNGTRALMNEVVRAIAAAHGWADWMPPTHAALVGKIESTPLYIRGSWNNWGTALQLRRIGPLRFAASTSTVLPAGRLEFKIASADWAAVDLGAAARDGSAAASSPHGNTARATALAMGGANLVLQVGRPGRYQFVLDARDDSVASLRVRRSGPRHADTSTSTRP